MKFRQFPRLFKLAHVWFRYGLDEALFNIPLLRPVKFLNRLNPLYWVRNRKLTYAQRLRLALESLGPIYVKFGQVLSTRRDLLPEDIADALSLLQDKVKPFPGELAQAIIEKSLGMSVTDCFADFDPEPLASASIAQVHCATLPDGQEVVVKVIRPGIERIIKQDIALMYTVAGLLHRHWPEAKRLRLLETVAEIERNLFYELDLFREAGNASQLQRNFKNSEALYIPTVYWDYCRRNVLVMERVYGIPIAQIDALQKHSINLKKLAERGVEIFYTQVFRDCFFHADMHPGNIMVNPDKPEDPQYISIDFGIVGSLSDEDKHYLAANFVAFFKRDYRQVAILHIESGWVPAETSVVEFESAIRTVCEPIFEKPLKDISYGHTLMRLFQVARQFKMALQPQLVLLQKTLINIEGIGRQLYPDLDLWATAKPFLEKWMRKEIGLRGLMKRMAMQWPNISKELPHMPDLLHRYLTQQATPAQPMVIELPKKRRTKWLAGLGVLCVIGGLLVWPPVWQWVTHWPQHWHANVLVGLGLILLVWSWLRI